MANGSTREQLITHCTPLWREYPNLPRYSRTLLTSSRMKLLSREFPSIPTAYIRHVLSEKHKLGATYHAMKAHERATGTQQTPYTPLKNPRRSKSHSTNNTEAVHGNSPLAGSLKRELNAAKKRAEREAGKYPAAVGGSILTDKRNSDRRKNTTRPKDTTRRNTLGPAPLWNASAAMAKFPRTESSLARPRRRISFATYAFVQPRRPRLGL